MTRTWPWASKPRWCTTNQKMHRLSLLLVVAVVEQIAEHKTAAVVADDAGDVVVDVPNLRRLPPLPRQLPEGSVGTTHPHQGERRRQPHQHRHTQTAWEGTCWDPVAARRLVGTGTGHRKDRTGKGSAGTGQVALG